jgi:hypothetical protein
VIKARVVRHRGHRFRSATLTKHVTYLKRDGVSRAGADARLFDAKSDVADERAFAERCEDDRHPSLHRFRPRMHPTCRIFGRFAALDGRCRHDLSKTRLGRSRSLESPILTSMF